mmetsp:Transcript_18633/g.44513  ORF Transcript_18633/g.44513 Transcript_18633/m.44513 type:complete len:219 (-) Transcript_18633:255-911(-)
MSPVNQINSAGDLSRLTSSTSVVVCHFWASWSEPSKHMNTVVAELAGEYPTVAFATIEAEEVEDVTEKHNVTSVPCFVFYQDGTVVGSLEGADAPALVERVAALAGGAAAAKGPQDVRSRIEALLGSAPVLLFMKGDREQARCGFSRRVVDALDETGVEYSTFDILRDEEIRQGLKEYSNWPTYPQLYVKGELMGGCDIIEEMHKSGELGPAIREMLA